MEVLHAGRRMLEMAGRFAYKFGAAKYRIRDPPPASA
jgi:hypothetical protein